MMHSMTSGKDMMMNRCKSDSAICKMMMGRTMDMYDMDKSKCKMMMGSMQEHWKGMQTMIDMGVQHEKNEDRIEKE